MASAYCECFLSKVYRSVLIALRIDCRAYIERIHSYQFQVEQLVGVSLTVAQLRVLDPLLSSRFVGAVLPYSRALEVIRVISYLLLKV